MFFLTGGVGLENKVGRTSYFIFVDIHLVQKVSMRMIADVIIRLKRSMGNVFSMNSYERYTYHLIDHRRSST